MGLDMFLVKKKKDLIISDYWDFKKEDVYWRKANMVHKFFCDNGEEIEEQVVYKISKEVLEELLNKCNKVLEIVKTKQGKVVNGQTWIKETGVWQNNYEDGLEITNPDEVAKILPTQSGCFFGNTLYNEYYLDDIKFTKKELEKLLEEINFDEYDIYYLASW